MTTQNNGPTAEELANPQLSVTLKGKRCRVEPMDGFGFQVLERMDEGSEPRAVETMYELAFRSVPTAGLTWDEFFGNKTTIGISPEIIGQIMQIARSQVEAVAATAKNASAATVKGATKKRTAQSSPGSRQSMPSGT